MKPINAINAKTLTAFLMLIFLFSFLFFGCQKSPSITREKPPKRPVEARPELEESTQQPEKGGKMMGKVLMIIASQNFRDEEFVKPKEILSQAGYEITVASSRTGEIRGMLGMTAQAETTIDKVNPDDYDAIIFVGGSGASEYWDNPTAHKIAQEGVKLNKIVAAICIAPLTLGKAGVLQGKKACAFPSVISDLAQAGASITRSEVTVDGNIVTAQGPEAADKFGRTILELLEKR